MSGGEENCWDQYVYKMGTPDGLKILLHACYQNLNKQTNNYLSH